MPKHDIDAKETSKFDSNSIFGNLNSVSEFFKRGAVGYSPNKNKYEGLKLQVYTWKVQPLEIMNVHSSFYENEEVFPRGSVMFDNALLMTKVEHEWKSMKDIAPADATQNATSSPKLSAVGCIL